MSNLKRQILVSKAGKSSRKITETFLGVLYSSLSLVDSVNWGKFTLYSSLRQGVFSEWSDRKITKKMCEMERLGYIRRDQHSNSIEFTNKAKIRIIDDLSLKHEVDGIYRFLSFDIPEQKRNQRDSFRRAIKKLGFKQVQKSLWVCNKNVGDLVQVIIDEYLVNEFVSYIISEKSDIDEHIKKMFLD